MHAPEEGVKRVTVGAPAGTATSSTSNGNAAFVAVYTWCAIEGWGLGCRVWGVGCRVWSLGCRVWGLVFGVWGLGFGVWGLGLRLRDVYHDPGLPRDGGSGRSGGLV